MWDSVEEKGTSVAELLGQHRYQLDAKQPATGDPDDATLRALGVEMSSR